MSSTELLNKCDVLANLYGFYYLAELIDIRCSQLKQKQFVFNLSAALNMLSEKYSISYVVLKSRCETIVSIIEENGSYNKFVSDTFRSAYLNGGLTIKRFICIAATKIEGYI